MIAYIIHISKKTDMGYIARLFWIFVPCAIFFAACTKEIKIDASSDASLRKSLINMSRGMSENEIKDFNNAVYGIIALVTNDIPKSENRTDIAIKKVRAMLNGKSAEEVLELYEHLAQKESNFASAK